LDSISVRVKLAKNCKSRLLLLLLLLLLLFLLSDLLSDWAESEGIGDVIDSSGSESVVDGVRSSHAGVGVAGLLLGGVDVVVGVCEVAELILLVALGADWTSGVDNGSGQRSSGKWGSNGSSSIGKGSSNGSSSISVDSSWVCVENGDGSAVSGTDDGLAQGADAVDAAGVGNSGEGGEQNEALHLY